ncbi:hypothetical protein PNIG_a1527 [Pseudoalteromonas nigrifaciens]|uniref:Uncharacterized protein n=1 Tax=Pseudoalteromonas nigrifaciens TaxID=28109 RepID=A0AAC9UHK9_9GAMM|nr:hypothetical protein [Pseudoalteromonas nigrifaciens]ASM53676.1 hypothetical protein PNIG_a1527 [Pseudoalteromonas nigrifaciens]GEN40670.1 hypothetical protein PNI02_01360 [Pseudoalteromonas nigrifaciens]SUC52479.1 Uncharacterised protein [Pseudoalteromonas nigrifaciens]
MRISQSRFLKYFSSVHPLINIASACSLFFSLCYEFWLNRLPETFSWGAELTHILSQVSIAIFSSYIFYLIVVKKKEVDDWENIKPTVALWVLRITSKHRRQLEGLEESSGLNIDQHRLDSIMQAFKLVSPREQCKLRISSKDGSYFNWYTSLIYDQDELEEIIDKLFNIAPFLDSELIAILNSLAGLEVKLLLKLLDNNLKQEDNLTCIAGAFFGYSKSCEKLNDYRLKHLDIF